MFTNKIYGYMEEIQKRKIARILEEVKPEGKILDVGSGPGFLSEFIGAVSVDIDLENLKKARGAKVLASGDFLPFRSHAFDIVFCIDVVHLLKNTGEIFRVCKEAVVSCFCNRYNHYEKLEFLKSIVPEGFVLKKSFIVREKEWDAVIVAKRI